MRNLTAENSRIQSFVKFSITLIFVNKQKSRIVQISFIYQFYFCLNLYLNLAFCVVIIWPIIHLHISKKCTLLKYSTIFVVLQSLFNEHYKISEHVIIISNKIWIRFQLWYSEDGDLGWMPDVVTCTCNPAIWR